MRSTNHVWDGKPASTFKFNNNNLTSCSSKLKQTHFFGSENEYNFYTCRVILVERSLAFACTVTSVFCSYTVLNLEDWKLYIYFSERQIHILYLHRHYFHLMVPNFCWKLSTILKKKILFLCYLHWQQSLSRCVQ